MVEMDLHLLDRGTIMSDRNFAIDGTTAATYSNRNPDSDYGEFAVWNLLVDHPDGTILWDTGSHPEAGDGYWPEPLFEAFAHPDAGDRDLETALSDVGYALDDIDIVVQSHLHLDHAGGLYEFAGTDVPVYVHQREVEFAYLSAKTPAGASAYLASDFDHDLNWQVVAGERQLVPGFELLHLPGHTPGLLGARLDTDAHGTVLVAGDEAFLRPNYEDEAPMGQSLTTSNADWRESLRRLKDIERRTDATVLYGHDPEQAASLRDEWH
jgi:N-acyl homoserine lactone hydrolase